ncbi:MAG: hypothetical protein P8170_13470, partial [Gemmatimonadota bacterium]
MNLEREAERAVQRHIAEVLALEIEEGDSGLPEVVREERVAPGEDPEQRGELPRTVAGSSHRTQMGPVRTVEPDQRDPV